MEAAVARALGAYYTPADLARPLSAWAIRQSGDRVFDPSFGEGVFLSCGVERLVALGVDARRLPDQIAGVELEARALGHAQGALLSRHPGLRWSRLAQQDFFQFAPEQLGKIAFDAVVGNPPYLRTQGRSPASKQRALEAARRAGVELGAEASTWAPFVAAAAGFVKPGGRLAMVVPREALFANYAKPLLAALQTRFARVHLIALDDYWFEGATVKVALLLAEGRGPGSLQLQEARDLSDLEGLLRTAPAKGPAPSWVASRIPDGARDACTRLLASDALTPLADLVQVRIGVVTGEKDYFLLPETQAAGLALPELWLPQTLSTPSQLSGSVFREDDFGRLERSGAPCRLLALPEDYAGGDAALDAYLACGIETGVDQNYKCRTRKPWFSVRRQLPPADLFLGYLAKRRLRIATNEARAHCTNNLHRLYLNPGLRPAAPLLAASALNAVSMLSAELTGRTAAAGALKIEPGDCARLQMIRPGLLLESSEATHRARAIDLALREGRDEDAFALADAWAARAAGWDARELARVRLAQRALRDARLR